MKPHLRDYADQPQVWKPERSLSAYEERKADRIAWILVALAIVTFLCVTARCETLPDAPVLGQPEAIHARLLTREFISAIAVNAGLRVTDAVITCHNLGVGGHEYMLPTQSCAGASAWVLSGIPVQVLGVWAFERTGHHKLARIVAWGMPASSAISVTFSATKKEGQ